MKEGNTSGFYSILSDTEAAVRRQQQIVETTFAPEDVGLSLRRTKSKSRFDMPYPPGNAPPVRKWDSEATGSSSQSKKSILEDYMLEEDSSSSSKKKSKFENPDESRGQWRDVTDEPIRKAKQERRKSPEPPTTDMSSWQNNPANSMEQLQPPGTYYAQPPPNFNQAGSYYQYDYQQYPGYPTYYQGYPDYGQGWGVPPTAQQQPPPPGLVLPDMSHPPPIQPPGTQRGNDHAPEPVPIPTTIKTEEPRPPAESPSPEPPKSQRSKEDVRSSDPMEFTDDGSRDAELVNQRETYMLKSAKLKTELEVLKHSQKAMMKDSHPDSHMLKENTKLQLEVQRKLKAIDNVVTMLNNILRSKERHAGKRKHRDSTGKESRSSTNKSKERSSSSSSSSDDDEEEEVEEERRGKQDQKSEKSNDAGFNLTFFDPEEHWCSVCGIFPATAKEFLNHLHTSEHKQNKDPTDIPWHINNVEKDRPHIKGAPTKRVPIRGLQFFVASQGWYCKLCSAWIGDLHCASMHLKSQRHMDNFEDFVDKNPNWEETWRAKRKEAKHRIEQLEEEEDENQLIALRHLDKGEDINPPRLEPTSKGRAMWGDRNVSASTIRESLKITVTNEEAQAPESRADENPEDSARSIRVQMRNKAPPPDSQTPMGPALPPEMTSYKKSNPWGRTASSSPPSQSNGSSRVKWGAKSQGSTISENEKEIFKNLKDKLKKKYETDDYQSKRDDRKERRKDRRFRERSYDRSHSHERSTSRGRSRGRSRSRGRDYGREKERDHSRSHSRERRRRRRSSSSRRGRSHSRSRSSDRKARSKVETRQWVAPPSSPPPYITRKTEDKDKWDKPKKKPAPNPVAALPKSKLPFIGRMPLLKRIAKKKQPEDADKSDEASSGMALASERRAPEDMEIDSGASDSEQNNSAQGGSMSRNSDMQQTLHTEEEETSVAQKAAAGIPLPQDFQDALSILFPDDPKYQQHLAMQNAAAMSQENIPAPPKHDCNIRTNISAEELMMLGMDPEDLVVQDFA